MKAPLIKSYGATLGFGRAYSDPMRVGGNLLLGPISRGLTTYASTGTASLGVNGDYSDLWVATGGPPHYFSIEVGSVVGSLLPDLSGYRAALFAWSTDDIDWYQPSSVAVPANYTIDTNTAALGSYPSSGWVTVATVTGNNLRSQARIFDLTGVNHVRINITAMVGAGATAPRLNVDVMDISRITYSHHAKFAAGIAHIGDSVTARSMVWGSAQGADASLNAKPSFSDYVFSATGRRTYQQNLGWSGSTSGGWVSQIGAWAPFIKCRCVELSLGINEAGTGVTPAVFNANMTSLMNTLWGLGFLVIFPSILACTASPYVTNIPALNAEITNIIAANPTKCIAGPDYFNCGATLGGDGIHPDGAGIVVRANFAANWYAMRGLA